MPSKRHIILFNASTATTGDWYKIADPETPSAIQVNMNASDTVTLQGTTLEAADVTALGTVAAADITDLKEYTGGTDFNDTLLAPFTFIRVTKTGTTGTAKVQGAI